MPSVSKIPQNANKYAIKRVFEINNEPLENAQGMYFYNGKVTRESELVCGTESTVINFDFKNNPKELVVHNHPNGIKLKLDDIYCAIYHKIKKIYVSTHSGFTALDLTTIKKTITKKEMLEWIAKKIKNWMNWEIH